MWFLQEIFKVHKKFIVNGSLKYKIKCKVSFFVFKNWRNTTFQVLNRSPQLSFICNMIQKERQEI